MKINKNEVKCGNLPRERKDTQSQRRNCRGQPGYEKLMTIYKNVTTELELELIWIFRCDNIILLDCGWKLTMPMMMNDDDNDDKIHTSLLLALYCLIVFSWTFPITASAT